MTPNNEATLRKLATYLQAHCLPARRLAKIFKVSRLTIYTRLKQLPELGYKVVKKKQRGGSRGPLAVYFSVESKA